ncbi:mycothione reductase [Gordonia soli]|uniref:Mycothione reductase n=1 Tax=Gordonia soli NBRC 108243 TaxID=1223545 RepID=M0QK12_9ACTN|nr:mycothione reductase [Gordonia soli]GAC68960.1 mycothione reductase [Gordonia soli NBRC 108243]
MSRTTHQVDLAIIGSGSGNSIPDERFDDRSIAIFEESTYGGTCLNVGCIPTKMFVYAAEVAEKVSEAGRYGVDATLNGVDWPAIVGRVFGRIDPISAGGREYRVDRCPNITVFESHVEFDGRDAATGRYRLVTADAEVLAIEVVLAAGSRSIIPPDIASGAAPFHTSDDVMRLPELPARITIVGGGYIAAEFAHVFGSLGSEVTLVVRGPALLRHHDEEVSRRFTELARKKWNVRLDTEVTATSTLADGTVRLGLDDGTTLDTDALLVATGRKPNGDRLNLGSVGIHLDEHGAVTCDVHGRTQAERIWTLGDVSSPYQLKHVANHEQRVVQANLVKGWDADDLESFDHRYVPSAVFTHPQIATVGLTEAQARDAGTRVTVKVQEYGDVAYGWAMEDTTGFCKIVADADTGLIVGAHIMGPQAPTVIQPVIQALSFGQTAREVARGQYWIHPGMPEVLENALLGLEFD